jgi:acyl-CoA dehydrogenase
MIRSAGYAGVSTPLAAGSVEAGWLLAQAGLHFEWDRGIAVRARGQFRLGDVEEGVALTGTIDEVAWPGEAGMLVAPVERNGRLYVACLETGSWKLPAAVGNIAGEPVVRGIQVQGLPVSCWAPTDLAFAAGMEVLELRRALAGAVGLAGVLQRTAELAISYAAQRVQFGQPISRFQAVQTHLCRLASEAQLVAVLVDSVQARLGEEANPVLDFGSIAAARSLAGRAAVVAARTAHQVHGAIGVTMEYPLHRLSRRLWEWEAAAGTSEYWSIRLGERAVGGDPGPWALITGANPLDAHDSKRRRL